MAKSPILLRSLAVLAAVAVPLLLALPGTSQLLGGHVWLGGVVALVCALPVVAFAKEARGQALVGAALAGLAAASTPGLPAFLALTADLDAMPVHDLRSATLPDDLEGYVAVQGYLRPEMVVDEYSTGGSRPDQNERPGAVLLPLLGTLDQEIQVDDADALGRVVILRVPPTKLELPPLQTLRGKLIPISDELVGSFFTAPVHAVMLDTFDLPTRGQALTRAALAFGASVLALVLLVLAVPRSSPAPSPRA